MDDQFFRYAMIAVITLDTIALVAMMFARRALNEADVALASLRRDIDRASSAIASVRASRASRNFV